MRQVQGYHYTCVGARTKRYLGSAAASPVRPDSGHTAQHGRSPRLGSGPGARVAIGAMRSRTRVTPAPRHDADHERRGVCPAHIDRILLHDAIRRVRWVPIDARAHTTVQDLVIASPER